MSIVAADYSRRFSPTFLGALWFLAPLLTVFALSETPSNITRLGTTPNRVLEIACFVCGIQLITDCATETARLARRNRQLLLKLGHTSSVINFAGMLGSQFLFVVKVLLCIVVFTTLGANLESAINVALTTVYWNLSLLAAGLVLSHLTSYLSILVLDVRYAVSFLPMILILFSGVYTPFSTLAELGFARSVLNPFLSLAMLNESDAPRLSNELMFSSGNALLLFGLSRLTRVWQARVARLTIAQYL